MANHNLPTLTSTYANFITEMDARMDDISMGFDPALTTATNLAVGSIRWIAANNKWQKWDGTSWNDLSSLYAINISGNSATVTNGVYINGSYSDPSWITSLAGTKISGNISGNASTATKLATARNINGVAFDGSATININLNNNLTISSAGSGSASGTTYNGSSAATISYDSIGAAAATGGNASGTWAISITGNCGGNAATVTNGVYTSGNQTIAGTKTFSGQVLLANGTVTAPSLAFSSDGATDTGLYWTSDGYTNFSNNGTYSGNMGPGGNFTAVGNITAYGSTTVPSDIRIKTNIARIDNALAKVGKLTGITYDRTDRLLPRQTGVIAQEVLKVLPEAIITLDDDQKTLTVAYGNLVGLLIEAIKELKAEVDELKIKVN